MAKVVTALTSKSLQVWNAAKPKLNTAWKYSKVELRPPTMRELPEVQNGIQKLIVSAKTGGYRKLTVKEAGLNVLIGAEIFFWFCAGECIGKGSLVGYNIPGATNWEIHF